MPVRPAHCWALPRSTFSNSSKEVLHGSRRHTFAWFYRCRLDGNGSEVHIPAGRTDDDATVCGTAAWFDNRTLPEMPLPRDEKHGPGPCDQGVTAPRGGNSF